MIDCKLIRWVCGMMALRDNVIAMIVAICVSTKGGRQEGFFRTPLLVLGTHVDC